jgi:hypothetical protein
MGKERALRASFLEDSQKACPFLEEKKALLKTLTKNYFVKTSQRRELLKANKTQNAASRFAALNAMPTILFLLSLAFFMVISNQVKKFRRFVVSSKNSS